MRTIEITRPDDWHTHLRDGPILEFTVAHQARYFGRSIIMPNLTPPVISVLDAEQYHARILAALPDGVNFQPLMTLYLSAETTAETIREAAASPNIHALKLYPAHATTNSAAGIADITSIYPLLEVMSECQLPLLIHGEATESMVDIFDREAVFIEANLQPIVQRFPELKVVLEHITTKDAVAYIESAPANVAATITAHHLLFNRNHMLVDGMKSPYYCLPILKRREHQEALLHAAISGNPKFFLGTDSAPHGVTAKENAWGCAAGSFTAHAAIELYAEAFDRENGLDRLEDFASHFGADFYGLPRNRDKIRLVNESWMVDKVLIMGDQEIIPIRSDDEIKWRVL